MILIVKKNCLTPINKDFVFSTTINFKFWVEKLQASIFFTLFSQKEYSFHLCINFTDFYFSTEGNATHSFFIGK